MELEGIDLVGVDKVCWGNDYPHYEGTFPYNIESLRLTFKDVPEHERRMILGENAAKLYDFDLDALRPIAAEHGPTPAMLNEGLDPKDIPEDSTCYLFTAARRELAEQQAAGSA